MTNKEQWEVEFDQEFGVPKKPRVTRNEVDYAKSALDGTSDVDDAVFYQRENTEHMNYLNLKELHNRTKSFIQTQITKAREEGKKEGEKNLPYWLSRGLKQGYREGLQKALELIPTLPDERKVAIFKGTEARTYEEKILARNVLLEAKEAIQNELNSKEKS